MISYDARPMAGICPSIRILAAAVIGALALSSPATAAEPSCTSSVGSTATGSPIKPTVALQSSGPANPMNMGGLRGTGMTDIAITASPALPETLKPEQITVDIPQRFARSGTGLSTAYLPEPTYSTPRILEHGKLITFTLCIDANHVEAGTYVGQVIVGGPPSVQPTTVAITLNAKDEVAFLIGLAGAIIVAAVLMLLRGLKLNYDKLPVPAAAADDNRIREAFKATRKEYFGFWAATIIGIVAATVAMLQVYDSNVSWGSDTIANVIALAGTSISAAGVGTFISSIRGS